jgi:hypothetical protein
MTAVPLLYYNILKHTRTRRINSMSKHHNSVPLALRHSFSAQIIIIHLNAEQNNESACIASVPTLTGARKAILRGQLSVDQAVLPPLFLLLSYEGLKVLKENQNSLAGVKKVRTHARKRTRTRTHTHTHTHTHTYTHTYTNARTRTHTHTNTHRRVGWSLERRCWCPKCCTCVCCAN